MYIVISFFIALFFSQFKVKDRYVNRIFVFAIFLMLFLSAGLRTGGIDYRNYVDGYNGNAFREPFFIFLSGFVHNTSNNPRTFFVITTFLISLLIYNYIKLEDTCLQWFIIYIYISNYYIQQGYIQIRIGLSCAIFIYAIYFRLKQQDGKAFLLWILAITCHFSMFFGGIIFLIKSDNITKKKEWLMIVCFFIAYLFAIKRIGISIVCKFIPRINIYYEIYTNAIKNSEGNGISIFNPISVLRFFLFFLCLKKRNILRVYYPKIDFILKIYFCGILSFLLFTDIPTFAFRLSEILFITEIILIPLIRYLFANKKIGNLFVTIIGLCFFLINVVYNKMIYGVVL